MPCVACHRPGNCLGPAASGVFTKFVSTWKLPIDFLSLCISHVAAFTRLLLLQPSHTDPLHAVMEFPVQTFLDETCSPRVIYTYRAGRLLPQDGRWSLAWFCC